VRRRHRLCPVPPLAGKSDDHGRGGSSVNPIAAGVLRRITEREPAEATDAVAREVAQDRMAFVDKSSTELIYDLICPRGHRMLRTDPQITRALTRTPGEWVHLG
jgi:hypothetical protein